MKRSLAALALAAAVATLTGCANSGFVQANNANTDRAKDYQANILVQAETDLKVIQTCFLLASGKRPADGTDNLFTTDLVDVPRQGDVAGCTLMAGMLRTQSNMLTAFAPFISKELFARVPASLEEILQSLVEKGFSFTLSKFGIDAVTKVVTSGQAASYQIAQSAMAKYPLVTTPTVITTSPTGESSILLQGGVQTVNP